MKHLIPTLALAAAVALAACNGTTEPPVPVALEILPADFFMDQGDFEPFEVRMVDSRGRPIAGGEPDIDWSVDDPCVADVWASQVLAVDGGTTMIRARSEGLEAAAASVTVTPRSFRGDAAFDYSGEVAGRFSVGSDFQTDCGFPVADSWAFAYYDPEWDEYVVLAFQARDESAVVGDLLYLFIDAGVTAGETVAWDDPRCRADESEWCGAFGFFDRGLDTGSGDVEAEYDLSRGTIAVSHVTGVPGPLVATFAADGFHPADEDAVERLITLANGELSVEIGSYWFTSGGGEAATAGAMETFSHARGPADLHAGVRNRIAEMRGRR